MPPAKERKPLYVTTIDNEKFAKVEEAVAKPIVWLALFVFGAIYMVMLALMMALGIYCL